MIKIKTKNLLKCFTSHLMNLEYIKVSLYEISYSKKFTFYKITKIYKGFEFRILKYHMVYIYIYIYISIYVLNTSPFFSVNMFLNVLLTLNFHQMMVTTQVIHKYKENKTNKFRN